MQTETVLFHPPDGWSGPLPALDSPRTMVLAFGSSSLKQDPAPLRDLVQAFPQAQILGCSSAGEIFGDRLYDGSCSAAVVKFDETELKSAATRLPDSKHSYAAGRQLAQTLNAPSLRSIFVLSDGLHVNGSKLVAGLNSVLPSSVIVTGGLAGDGDRFLETWVIHEGMPAPDHVVALGLYGERIRVGHGSRGGWDRFGPQRRVTRSEGNVLFELDGRPALALYKTYLGERAAGLPATGLLFPLAVTTEASSSKELVRTVLAVDETKQSLTFAGDIPQGSLAQLMFANFDRLVTAAQDAARITQGALLESGPGLGIAISCVGRRLVLGEMAEEEIEAALGGLRPGTELVGFYSYGEISPFTTGSCDLHNQTMTLTTFHEGK